MSAACIASRGTLSSEEYPLYVQGIHDLRGHIYAENYSPETAVGRAAKVMYMAACLLKRQPYEKIEDPMGFYEKNHVRLSLDKRAEPASCDCSQACQLCVLCVWLFGDMLSTR